MRMIWWVESFKGWVLLKPGASPCIAIAAPPEPGDENRQLVRRSSRFSKSGNLGYIYVSLVSEELEPPTETQLSHQLPNKHLPCLNNSSCWMKALVTASCVLLRSAERLSSKQGDIDVGRHESCISVFVVYLIHRIRM
jgi:hypothetical protein